MGEEQTLARKRPFASCDKDSCGLEPVSNSPKRLKQDVNIDTAVPGTNLMDSGNVPLITSRVEDLPTIRMDESLQAMLRQQAFGLDIVPELQRPKSCLQLVLFSDAQHGKISCEQDDERDDMEVLYS